MPCVILGWLTSRVPVFYGALAAWVALFSVSTLLSQLTGSNGWLPMWYWLAAYVSVCTAVVGAALLFRERLPLILAIALFGMLMADAAIWASEAWLDASVRPAATVPSSARPAHTIHIVLDEQIGLAGFGSDLSEAIEAERTWRDILLRHRFTVFPRAFSNYDVTLDSLPAILWDRSIKYPNEALTPNHLVLRNMRFADASARGMRLAVYQSDFLGFNDNAYAYDLVRTYRTNELSALLLAPGTVTDRARHIALRFGLMDRPVALLLQPYIRRTNFWSNLAPLTTKRVWPDVLSADIRSASEPTLFFMHLMSPHRPFAYRADGSIRPLATITRQPSDARGKRAAYAEQSQWLARQVDGLLGALEASGTLESATVILHGDHGSRIRTLPDEAPPEDWSASEVTATFSALFAYRTPVSGPARIDTDVESLVRLLRRVDGRPLTHPGEDLSQLWVARTHGGFAGPLSAVELFKE